MKVVDGDGKKIDIDIFIEKISTGGRPRKVITQEGAKLIESMARIMCTEEEIAQLLDTSIDTLLNADNKEVFRNAINKGKSTGKQSLRRMQYQLAMKGNVKMLIWLGKQVLGQTDKFDTNANVNTDDNFKLMQAYMGNIKNGKECETEEKIKED